MFSLCSFCVFTVFLLRLYRSFTVPFFCRQLIFPDRKKEQISCFCFMQLQQEICRIFPDKDSQSVFLANALSVI